MQHAQTKMADCRSLPGKSRILQAKPRKRERNYRVSYLVATTIVDFDDDIELLSIHAADLRRGYFPGG